jgi:hypothetical protein
MAKSKKEIIETELKNLENTDNIAVCINGDTVEVSHKKAHAASFKFKWLQQDHFTGYFVDRFGIDSQAVVSIESKQEAKKFVQAYSILVELRAAKRK